MKSFKRLKTIQLFIMLLLVVIIFFFIFSNSDLFHALAANPDAKKVFVLFWLLQLVSFIFIVYDFSIYRDVKKKYTEMDMAMYSDALTGMGNRSSLDAYIEAYKGKELPTGVGAVTFRITGIVEINKEYGTDEGDFIIKTFSNILSARSKGQAFVGRNGGNNFLAIMKDTSMEAVKLYVNVIQESVDEFNGRSKGAKISFSYGCAVHTGQENPTISELISRSYKNSMES